MQYFKHLVRKARLEDNFLLKVASGVAFLAALFFAIDAMARPGGGGNYRGGGGFGGGGGGGGDGIGFFLMYLVFRHPEIGVPVLIVVVVASAIKRARNPDRMTAKAVQKLEHTAAPNLGALEDIKARDQGFDKERFLDRVRQMQDKLNESWCRGETNPVRTLLSDGLMRRFETQLAIMKHQGIRNAMADHKVLDLQIHAAEHDSHFDTLHVAIRSSARDVEVDAKLSYDEALAKAAKAPASTYAEIWSFLRKPGVQTLEEGGAVEGRCPSCGAPLELGQATRCDHCQALVNSGEHDWVLAEITQPEEWRHGSTGQVPGLAALQAADPGFNRQVAEDRASYLFWRWIEALVLANAKPLVKMAAADFHKTIAEDVKSGPASLFKVAVGGVDLVACQAGAPGGQDRYNVKVLWSSARSQKSEPFPAVNVLTISRKSGAQEKSGLSYARCPNCQGPLTENDTPTCEYCGTDLAAGETDWVLENVLRPEELMISSTADRAEETPVGGAPVPPDMGNPRERTLLLMRMAAVVVADGVVTKEERKLLKNAAKRWSVPLESVEPILNGEVEPDVAMTMRPSNPRAFVAGLVSAALVDGRIDRKEERLLIDVGQSLGMATQQVRNIMTEMGG
ncbi:MAG: TIM44-like domain-containing protein [Deltaproteobacteria bacterium]|nr:TIM44-like domain-containing protein [Deltaproteobacteria bacterium]